MMVPAVVPWAVMSWTVVGVAMVAMGGGGMVGLAGEEVFKTFVPQ